MTSKIPSFPGKLGKLRKHNPYYVTHNTKSSADQKEYSQPVNRLVQVIIQSAFEKETQTDAEMLVLLLKHYKIDQTAENKWLQLSYSLALDTVPAFRYENASRGRPKKWTHEKKQSLKSAVNIYLKKHSNHSAKDACRHLAKKNTFQITNADSLYTRYMEAK